MALQQMVMIDLETMGVKFNAVICSIGAVKFTIPSESDKTFVSEFYCTIDARDCKKHGLTVSQSTIDWWTKQDSRALKALTTDCLPLVEALEKFSTWYGKKSLPTWGNGAGFDNVLMQSAYEAIGKRRPWLPWEDRCYRTVKNLIQVPEPEREGTYHNALDDAKYQTSHLIRMLQ